MPTIGTVDSERNCISNVRPAGLDYAGAAGKLLYLLRESHRLQLSGILLKDVLGSSQVPREPHRTFAPFLDPGRTSAPSLRGAPVLPPFCWTSEAPTSGYFEAQ